MRMMRNYILVNNVRLMCIIYRYTYISCITGQLDVYNWSIAWQLFVLVSATCFTSVGRLALTGSYTNNKSNLLMCCIIRDLGILIRCDINFTEHIYSNTESANQRAFIIEKCFFF